MLSVPFALTAASGLCFSWVHMSVAVAVGFSALAGVAAETGVVMLIISQRLNRENRTAATRRKDVERRDLYHAIIEGAVERVRPKMMTVCAIMAGLLPILWSAGTGSEVMQRIAVRWWAA